jgi:hypothetical protein
MARKYARDNRGRFAAKGSGATARGGRLKTASGGKRQGQTMKSAVAKNTVSKPKGLKPGSIKPKTVKPQSGKGKAPATKLQKPVAYKDGTFNVNGRDASNPGSAARMYARQRTQEKEIALAGKRSKGVRASMRRAEREVAANSRIGQLPTTRRMAQEAMSTRNDKVESKLRSVAEKIKSGSKERVRNLNAASRNPSNKAAQRRAAEAKSEQDRLQRSLRVLKKAQDRYKGYLGRR